MRYYLQAVVIPMKDSQKTNDDNPLGICPWLMMMMLMGRTNFV